LIDHFEEEEEEKGEKEWNERDAKDRRRHS